MKIGVSLPVRELKNDLGAIREYAQTAEEMGLTHLRVPDQVIRPDSGHMHEPMMMMAYIAAITTRIELCPSVIILPSRQTALLAKQVAELDVLSAGRTRLGVGIGASADEYRAMGADFSSRGARCDEQLTLLKQLWTQKTVQFDGRWDQISGMGIDPLPVQKQIPIWIGARPVPSEPVVRRMGRHADGWIVLCSPEEYPEVKGRISAAAVAAEREPDAIGSEAGVAVVGPREAEWRDRVAGWRAMGLSHLCLRTLGGGLSVPEHAAKLEEVVPQVLSET